jgi:hypothetical protein
MNRVTLFSIASLVLLLMTLNLLGLSLNHLLGLSTVHYNWTSQIIVAIIVSLLVFMAIKIFRNMWILPLGYFLVATVLLFTSSSLTESSLIIDFLYSIVGVMSLIFKPFEVFLIEISIYIYILILPLHFF